MRILLIVLMLAAPLAFAGDRPQLELGLGVTHATHQENMTWWQNCEHDGCPYKLRMTSPSASIGLKWPVDSRWLGFDRWHLRTGYEYLGKFRSDAVATASDYNYGTCRYAQAECWPMSNWHGVGDVQGLYVTAIPERDMGSYALFFEAGLYAYWSRWKVDIPDWRPTREGPVQSLTARHEARWEYACIVGIGVRKGGWSMALTRRDARATGDLFPAIYHGPATNLSARYAF